MIQKDEAHHIYSFEKAWEKCSDKKLTSTAHEFFTS
jgi:hypothetical protein